MKDYYYILGIDKNASLEEIEEAYHKLWAKFHPAKNNRDPHFENLFYDVREAFQHLSNPTLRKEYNEKYESFVGKDVQSSVKEDSIPSKDPFIIEFRTDKKSVYEGDTIKITWQTEHADKVTISCFRGEQEPAGNKMHTVTRIRDREVIPLKIEATNSVTNKSVDKRITIDSQLHIDIKNKVAGIPPDRKENKEEEVVAPQKKKEDKKETLQKREEKSQEKKPKTVIHNKNNGPNSKATSDTTHEPKKNENEEKLMPVFMIAAVVIIIIIGAIIIGTSKSKTYTSDNIEAKAVKVKNENASAENIYSKEEILRKASTPKNALKMFFDYINHGNFRGAYWLSDNEIWKPFKKFSEEAWSNYKNIKPVSFYEKEYHSKYGADRIIEATFTTFDPSKAKTLKLTYDFHLKMNSPEGKWQIVRMTYPKEVDTWYYDDPLYEYKSDEKLLIHNKPYALLQGYYDNFGSKELVESNAEYYNDVLVLHHADELITRSRALTKDYEDFIEHDIKSYQILVDVVNLKVDQYEKFNIISVPLNYYVTKINGDQSKFTLNNIKITISKDNAIIYAIGSNYSVDDFLEVIRDYSN